MKRLIEIEIRNKETVMLLPAGTVQVLQDVLEHGYDRGKNGMNCTIEENLRHAILHISDYLRGHNTGEPSLKHAFTRLMIAVDIEDRNASMTQGDDITNHRRYSR
jgi:putative hemolysin